MEWWLSNKTIYCILLYNRPWSCVLKLALFRRVQLSATRQSTLYSAHFIKSTYIKAHEVINFSCTKNIIISPTYYIGRGYIYFFKLFNIWCEDYLSCVQINFLKLIATNQIQCACLEKTLIFRNWPSRLDSISRSILSWTITIASVLGFDGVCAVREFRWIKTAAPVVHSTHLSVAFSHVISSDVKMLRSKTNKVFSRVVISELN